MKKLSIIVPCYNEQQNVQDFYLETQKYVQELLIAVEYVFIDDGSKTKHCPSFVIWHNKIAMYITYRLVGILERKLLFLQVSNMLQGMQSS